MDDEAVRLLWMATLGWVGALFMWAMALGFACSVIGLPFASPIWKLGTTWFTLSHQP